MLHLHFPMTGDQLTAAFRQRHWAKVGPPFRRLGILVLLLATLLAGSAFGPLHNAVSGELKAFLLVSTLIFALVLGVSFLVAALGLRLVTKALGPAPALRPRLDALGLLPAAEGPGPFARFLAAERGEFGALIRDEGIRLDS